MTSQEIISFCLTLPAVYEDYPFDEVVDENATTVMRHKANKKSFALIMRHKGELYLNLKCNPFDADFLRGAFKSIIPGWHMNKRHWVTVIVGDNHVDRYICDVPEDLIKKLIADSYNLIKPKVRKRKNAD